MHAPPSPTPTRIQATVTGDTPGARRQLAMAVLGFFLFEGLLRAAYFHLGARAEGGTRPLLDTLGSELTSTVAALVGFLVVVLPLCRRRPLDEGRWRTNAPAHLLGFVAYSLLKTSLMWAQRSAIWPVFGLGRYDFGDLLYRVPMEGSLDVLAYLVMVAGVHMWWGWRRTQERRLRELSLEARLSEARLEALQAQLQPHFLFNTLNTISSVMYDDPAAADRLMARLSELLRASLSHRRDAEIAVAEELALLDPYLDIARARFGDRLTVTTRVAPDVRDARVPPLLLQPLVENAVRHTVGERPGRGEIGVQILSRDGQLVCAVEDDGPGLTGPPDGAFGQGVGLANTRDRLRWLHGDDASLTLTNRTSGGLTVEVVLPLRRGAPARDGRHG